MNAAAFGLVLVAILAAPTAILACGVCDEDKIAATYDHAVVQRAAADGDVMVYSEIAGPLDAARVKAAVGRVPGVRPDSVRVAMQPAALSFALDPNVLSPDAALLAAQRELPSETRLRRVQLRTAEPADGH